MEALERRGLAYAALQRLWVTLDPESAETRWQQEFAFMQLPDGLKKPALGTVTRASPDSSNPFHPAMPESFTPSFLRAWIPPRSSPSRRSLAFLPSTTE